MNNKQYDYIVIGFGLAGSVLSYFLIKEGKTVLVIDKFNPNSSSQVAAGLVNPVTGRRVVKSWMADTLLPFAENFYSLCEKELGQKFYHPMDVLEVVTSVKELNEWTSRSADIEMKKYFQKEAPENIYRNKICEFKKMMRINSSAWMNIPVFIKSIRKKITGISSIVEDNFEFNKLTISDSTIRYENFEGKNIIFCEGYRTLNNPLWNTLPLVPAKGEILTVKCVDLPEDFILLSGIFFIPLGDHKFRVGSTYEWNFSDELPTEEGKIKLQNLVEIFLKIPFTILDHRAGVRPTVKDRRPLIGSHRIHKNVFVFNGMGTKGVLLAPYFADHFVKVLSGKETLMDEIDVNRFAY